MVIIVTISLLIISFIFLFWKTIIKDSLLTYVTLATLPLLTGICIVWFFSNVEYFFQETESLEKYVAWACSIFIGYLYFFVSKNVDILAQQFAELISTALNRLNPQESFWTRLDILLSVRGLIITFLTVLSFISIGTLLTILFPIQEYVAFNIDMFTVGVIVIVLFVVDVILTTWKGQHCVYELIEHKRESHISEIAQTVSLAAGINPPTIKIFKHANPNAFTLIHFPNNPTVYFSLGLVNILNDREIEAVIAHEINHIINGYHLTKRMLFLLYASINFFLTVSIYTFLALFAPQIIVGLVLIGVYAAAEKSDIYQLSPVHVFVKLLSTTFEYVLTFNEDLYADVHAVKLLRRPDTLYSALHRISTAPRDTFLSDKYRDLYFVGDHAVFTDIPMPQPPISIRLATIRLFDDALEELPTKDAMRLKCPACAHTLNTKKELGHYGTPIIIDTCPHCHGVWFDNLEFMSIADKASLLNPSDTNQSVTNEELRCPLCGVALHQVNDHYTKQTIRTMVCPNCRGSWMSQYDIQTSIGKMSNA